MRGLLKVGLLTGLLFNTLSADVVFDLGAQQFYYPITKLADRSGFMTVSQFREASYDVDTAIASTGLTSVNGYYRPEDSRSGYFGVQIKEPKVDSGVIFSIYCYLYQDGCSVQLLGKDGQAVSIDFAYNNNANNFGKISVNGTTKYGIGNRETNINGVIEIDASEINIIINGSYTFTVNKQDFQLSKINISLYTDSGSYRIDKLTSLTISNSD